MVTLPRQMRLRFKKLKRSLQKLKLRVKRNRKLQMRLSRNFKILKMRLRQDSKRPRSKQKKSSKLKYSS
jgi:hypothetical protein